MTASNDFPECAMLDDLTKNQRYYMFNLVPPTFNSDVGRRMNDNSFSWNMKTFPMVHGSEEGLVLYTRVVAPNEENNLKQLAKPKTTRPHAIENKASRTQERLSAAQQNSVKQSQAKWSNKRPSQPSQRPAAHVTGNSSSVLTSNRKANPPIESTTNQRVVKFNVMESKPEPAATTSSHSQHATSLPHGAGAMLHSDRPDANNPKQAAKYGLHAHKPSQEEQEMKRYVEREKAVMTASHVFTWGGRFKYSGPENGLSRQTWATGISKQPLRL
ncbi:hypothetical protein CEUSTIGMA_g8502.t1 [Chlamydomonas eustigma]|uniref:Uncharacterized protein n=1 Tax=Chlamydomonas eustigma TaxID=1157962 RepID=A0A250XDB1_9CHLO|nr:hypothetical protein CEUSTIGMA_g8502.t1 [Chlamydomonas eustigma]|eukprot:GAX81067.1 hypothetical protein CEUSTIGMA_g8502.t1 [Chlamydomonas eustigma]